MTHDQEMGLEPDYEALAASLPPRTAEEVLPSVLAAMDGAQRELAFRHQQATLVRHVVVSMGGPEVTEETAADTWARIETQVRGGLGMPANTPPASVRDWWEHVEDWLLHLDPRVIEQAWVNNSDFSKSNAQSVKDALLDRLRKEVDR